MKEESIIKDFILTVLTFGLWNLYVQFRQIEDANDVLKKGKYSLFKTLVLSIVTLGLYFCYHEYKLTLDLKEKIYGKREKLKTFWVFILTFFGVWPAVDSYQQILLNMHQTNSSSMKSNHLHQLIIVGFLYTILLIISYLFLLTP